MLETSELFFRVFFFRVLDFEYWAKIEMSVEKILEKISEVSEVSGVS